MSSHSNADVFIQPIDPTFPPKSRESYPPSWIHSESKGLSNPKPIHNNQDGSTAAPSGVSRLAWLSLSIFKWAMFKRKKEPLVGEQASYLQSVQPGSAALRYQGDQGDFGGGLRASGASATRVEKPNSLLKNLGLDDHNKPQDGPQEEGSHASHPPWSLQATANRQAEITDRAKAMTSPRLQASHPSGTQDMGNGAAAEYAESKWSTLTTGNDHVRFGEHNARLEASRSDASLLDFLSKQEQQDRQLAEQLVRDEELAAALQDLENQARSRDEASLMLAIELADGLVQDHDDFILQQTESIEMAHISQRENDLQELQLQADSELALRLQNESATMVSDNGLGGRILNRPHGWRNKRGARRQQTNPDKTFRQALMKSDSRPLYEDGRVDNAQRSNSTGQGMSIQDRNERQSQRWNQPFEDRAYAQQLQLEFDQQEQWHTEAQRLQDTIAAEDRQIQDKIEAEQVEIKRQEQEHCLICTEAYDKADMVRPCQHWYCPPCLSGKMSYTRLAQPLDREGFH